MNIDQEVLQVLSNAIEIDNHMLKITGHIDRKLYLKVNKVLESIGGKWSRKFKAHVFEKEEPIGLIDRVLLTGTVNTPEDLGYFPTPKEVTEIMLDNLDLKSGQTLLEPSSGEGHILDEIHEDVEIVAIELDDTRRNVLQSKGYHVMPEKDFLKFRVSQKFERIIMNPPFKLQQDIDHVNHAYELLEENGILVSIMSAGVTFRQNKKTVEFRKLVEQHGHIEELPNDSFKTSGTRINTVMVVLKK